MSAAPSRYDEESSSSSNSSSNTIESRNKSANPSMPGNVSDSINSSFSSVNATDEAKKAEAAPPTTMVSTEQERQILLLMLLAQVCALHDPTPKTFTVHVLELYERGLLERQSIAFLFDLGLVPDQQPATTTYALLEPEQQKQQQPLGLVELTLSPAHHMSQSDIRAQETSAIRSRLAHDERRHHQQQQHTKSPRSSSSWAVEQHPLSLSRYQRDFQQGRLLNRGSFGSVYCAMNVLDGREYAIKQVMFAASGYNNDSIQQVVREVRCLAHCDHPNVVRYYTSWLEPSWVTGSGHAVTNVDQIATKETQRKLLTDIQYMLTQGQSSADDWGENTGSRHESWESSRSIYSDWKSDGMDGRCSQYQHNQQHQDRNHLNDAPKQQQQHQQQRQSYRYQMGFYIQMQLCSTSTLADWIRTRNNGGGTPNWFQSATEVFGHIVQGIRHIHEKGILHRDLKPANIFCGEDGLFKIGDFGLSKLLKAANGGQDFYPITALQLPSSQAASVEISTTWQDPLTAGIGTASYCAPEQLSTKHYGPEADIFSLGLIFLELVCRFGTEHERMITFRDCRRGVLPKELNDDKVASIILACTNKDPLQRPTADALVALTRDASGDMHRKLQDSERELQLHKSIIAEKDRIILELTRKMEHLESIKVCCKKSNVQTIDELDVGIVESVESTTFDDDDY